MSPVQIVLVSIATLSGLITVYLGLKPSTPDMVRTTKNSAIITVILWAAFIGAELEHWLN